MRGTLLTASGIALLGLAAAAPRAQEAPQSSGAIEEVVVTAQKRTENVQDVPAAITAVSGDTIERLGITQAEDLSRISPAIQGTRAGGAITQFYIRGVGNYGTNVFAEAAVATNLNGVNLSRPTTIGGMFFDLERVEALKGPQGTLYGRNATGGAINLISARPAQEMDGYVGLEGGDYGLIKVNGALGGGLTDSFSMRGAFQYVKHDGYFSDGYEDEDTKSGRLSALYETDGISWLTVVDYEDVGGKGGGGAITPFLEDDHPWIGATDQRSNAVLTAFALPFTRGPLGAPDGYNDIKTIGASSQLDVKLGSTTLTLLPAYRDSDVEYLSWAPGFHVFEHDQTDTFSFEARLASSAESRLQWVVGAYYFDEDTTSDGLFLQQVQVWNNFPNFPPTLSPLSATENSTDNHFTLTTEAWAGFGQVTFSVTDDLRLTVGGRYTSEDKGMEGVNTTDPPEFPAPVAPFTIQTPGSDTWSKTTWRAGVDYDLSDDNLLYVSASTGFKAGGFFSEQPEGAGGCSLGNTFDQETLTAYALGSKNRFGNRVQLNGEIFYWDYKDHQEPHLSFSPCGYTIFPTENIGQATMQGVDLEAEFAVLENGRLSLQVQYLDANFDEFAFTTFSGGGNPGNNGGNGAYGCPATPIAGPLWTVDCSGKQAIRAPEWSGIISYRHAFPLGGGGHLVADLRSQLASSTYIAIDYREASLQDSYHMSDAGLTYESAGGKWSVGAWVRNIEDEPVMTNSFTSPFTLVNYTQLKAPRTYGATVRVNF